MILTDEDKEDFENSTNCHICGGELGEDRVRDHCHLYGKFRGVAHNNCNLNYRVRHVIPIFLHNLSYYDAHLFIKRFGNPDENISCIAITFGKKIVVSKYTDKDGKKKDLACELKFVDSFRFISSSLEELTNNLDKDQCKNLKKFFDDRQLNLLKRKDVYPYDYVDSVDKLAETALPPKEAFFSKLNDEQISDEDYEHAKKIWKEFNMKTLMEYHELYNISDVLLLADVFENFRDVCIKHYNLDPAWYLTAPGLAWDAMLKTTTGVILELLTDIYMLLMIKNGIRGGVAMISNRYGKANNKYMGQEYDETQPSKFIAYWDANNLYSWAMSKPLPTGGFEWMDDAKLEN